DLLARRATRSGLAARSPWPRLAETFGQYRLQLLALLRLELLRELGNGVQRLALGVGAQLAHLLDQRIDLGHVDGGLLQLGDQLLADLLDVAEALAAMRGVLLECRLQRLTLIVAELEVLRQRLERAEARAAGRRTGMHGWPRIDPAAPDEARQDEAVQQQG